MNNKTESNEQMSDENKVRISDENKKGTFADKNTMCKKCLTSDMPEASYFKNMYEYIEGLDEDVKVGTEEYNRRLMICKDCDNLLNGMCKKCGCFVEMRAIIKNKQCPDVKMLW